MIPVIQPVEREVTNDVGLTGQTAAVKSAEIRPRVTGYQVERLFEERADV